MAQNTSIAVMAQRREPRDSLDDFPTPSWSTRALIRHVIPDDEELICASEVWEPACNRGFMARPLAESFGNVVATDIHDYGYIGQDATGDFLFPGSEEGLSDRPFDWVITNPPFRLAERFIFRGLEVARVGVAVIVRTSFLEGIGRYSNLFMPTPPSIVAQFTERVPMVRGRCDPRAGTATSYCWMVWIKGMRPQPFIWIPPCRRDLERPGDYDIVQ